MKLNTLYKISFGSSGDFWKFTHNGETIQINNGDVFILTQTRQDEINIYLVTKNINFPHWNVRWWLEIDSNSPLLTRDKIKIQKL